ETFDQQTLGAFNRSADSPAVRVKNSAEPVQPLNCVIEALLNKSVAIGVDHTELMKRSAPVGADKHITGGISDSCCHEHRYPSSRWYPPLPDAWQPRVRTLSRQSPHRCCCSRWLICESAPRRPNGSA